MVDVDAPVIEFTAHSRCDGCGAQAYTLAKHEDFGELMFCAHHARDSRQQLFDAGWEITDDITGLEDIGYALPELV